MRPLISLMLLTVLIVLPVAVKAQESPSPFPPDPAILFAEGVEVVSVEIEEPPAYLKPKVETNDSARIVRVLDEDSGEWREYPYPDEVKTVSSLGIMDDDPNTLRLADYTSYGGVPDPRGLWFLDLTEGTYSQPEIICERQRTAPEDGYWVVYDLAEDDAPPELCNLGTGERIPLDLQVNYFGNGNTTTVKLSPDQTKALLMGYWAFYVYTFADHKLIKLGDTQTSDVRDGWWLGNDTVLVYETEQGSMTFPWLYYSLADANVEDSLHRITTVYKPRYLDSVDNPKRFEWVEYREDGGCNLTQIHEATGQIDSYELDDLCGLGIVLNADGDRLYAPIRYEDSPIGSGFPVSRRIVRFNPYTGEYHELMQGEVEYVMDVSQDGTQAVLVLDDSGLIDMLASGKVASVYYQRDKRPDLNIRLAIVDLTDGHIIYEVDVPWLETGLGFDYPIFYDSMGMISTNFEPDYSGGPNGGLFDIAPNRYLLMQRQPDYDYHFSLIEIIENGVQVSDVPPVLLVLPDANRMIVGVSDGEDGVVVYSYDSSTDEQTALTGQLKGIGRDRVRLWEHLEMDGLSISIRRADAPDEVAFSVFDDATKQTAIYTLRLP